jgi:hypothetical protein
VHAPAHRKYGSAHIDFRSRRARRPVSLLAPGENLACRNGRAGRYTVGSKGALAVIQGLYMQRGSMICLARLRMMAVCCRRGRL